MFRSLALAAALCLMATTAAISQTGLAGKWATDRPADPLLVPDGQRKQSVQLELYRSLLFPLSHLGLARAYALAGDKVKARKSYDDFFAIWKSADADIPVLIEARREYAQLQ